MVVKINDVVGNIDIHSIEKRFNVSLPEEYISFLQKTNGGTIISDSLKEFELMDSDGRMKIKSFFGVEGDSTKI